MNGSLATTTPGHLLLLPPIQLSNTNTNSRSSSAGPGAGPGPTSPSPSFHTTAPQGHGHAHGHGHGHGLAPSPPHTAHPNAPAAAPLHPGPTSAPEPASASASASLSGAAATTTKPPHPRSAPLLLDPMRAYRACLNCRNRKSKCDLDVNGGRPPCRRCQREARDCVLGESHRGGRRVRKKPKLDDDVSESVSPSQPPVLATPPGTTVQYSPIPGQHVQPAQSDQPTQPAPPTQPTQSAPPFHLNRYESRPDQGFTWQLPTPTGTISSEGNMSKHGDHMGISQSDAYRQRAESTISILGAGPEVSGVHGNLASADLQNPSDALDILAQVADRAEEGDSSPREQTPGGQRPKIPRLVPRRQNPSPPKLDDHFHYKPIQDGLMSPSLVYDLFWRYENFFHPFFPIIPRQTFDQARIPWLSRAEPHLFSAILTVASKDNEQVHPICYDHMQQLVSMIVAGADADVEAVEALLLMSQWVSHRPQASISVGRGEEDRVAWMYIGTALRLAYYLGIDRTSFKGDSREDSAIFNRQRLVWAACYVSDRQVSVRTGKGFWSRGPGPLSGLKAADFPTLQPVTPEGDNHALIFQATLELTQIFSNVHDILYSTKGHGWKEMLEGRYAKYLDDFRIAIRSWNDVWGTLICSPSLKTCLLLTYDYLRLYVNAFAYQATISRALTFRRDSQHTPNRPIPLINASAPDARFIYEALDAAKSLLSTFNNFIDPETLRSMPSSYYLFIIYSAVFLYKARSTTTMTDEERQGVKRMIQQTIERLQKASKSQNHMGSRYARLLQLLWRKAPKARKNRAEHDLSGVDAPSIDTQTRNSSADHRAHTPSSRFDTSYMGDSSSHMNQTIPSINNLIGSGPGAGSGSGPGPGHLSGFAPFSPTLPSRNDGHSSSFSWLDLGATWNFATQNGMGGASTSGNGSVGELDEGGVLGVEGGGMSPLDMMDGALLADYSLLEGGGGGGLIF